MQGTISCDLHHMPLTWENNCKIFPGGGKGSAPLGDIFGGLGYMGGRGDLTILGSSVSGRGLSPQTGPICPACPICPDMYRRRTCMGILEPCSSAHIGARGSPGPARAGIWALERHPDGWHTVPALEPARSPFRLPMPWQRARARCPPWALAGTLPGERPAPGSRRPLDIPGPLRASQRLEPRAHAGTQERAPAIRRGPSRSSRSSGYRVSVATSASSA